MKVKVVLVRPIYPRNIGACARALSNMGGDGLIMIGGSAIDDVAKDGAATAQSHLLKAVRYASWDEFEAGEVSSLRLAFTARDGKNRRLETFTEVLHRMSLSKDQAIHLVFGPEDHGLSTEDLRHCHVSCGLPVFGENPSLNLAQAVLLALYILQDRANSPRTEFRTERPAVKASPSEFPDETLRSWLKEIGWEQDEDPAGAYESLRRLMLAAGPDARECRLLGSFLMKSLKSLRGERAN